MQLDWPFYHHDVRRTGFTLLKGDIEQGEEEEVSFTLEENMNASYVDLPSIADIDEDGKMELVTVSKLGTNPLYGDAFVYVMEYDKGRKTWKEEMKITSPNSVISRPPSLADIDNNGDKEIIFIRRQGTYDAKVYAVNLKQGDDINLDRDQYNTHKVKWAYSLPSDAQQNPQERDERMGHTAVADVDLDGSKEILFTDIYLNTSWQAYLYVLNSDKTLQKKVPVGLKASGGHNSGVISMADINNDNYPEIIVPMYYGIYAYKYLTNGSFQKMWNNSDSTLRRGVAISDVDVDNEYELVYATDNSSGGTNRLRVLDAESGTVEQSVNLAERPLGEPAVGNLDTDANLEIAIVAASGGNQYSYYGTYYDPGHVYVYDADGTSQGQYPSASNMSIIPMSVAPDIADINKDGKNDIVFGTIEGTIHILKNSDGSTWSNDMAFSLGGELVSAPAIADLDSDGLAEIAAKHLDTSTQTLADGTIVSRVMEYGQQPTESQILMMQESEPSNSLLTIIGGFNEPPSLDKIDPIYAIENELIHINATATDANNDNIAYYFSSPFNGSGLWQTTVNDSGTYETFVEASDGNLSDSQFVQVTVFEHSTILQNKFSDSTIAKNLSFSSAGNMTVNITLPNNVTVLRAAIRLKGYPLSQQNSQFQETITSLIDYNNLSNDGNNMIDKNWNTYYTAGRQTGAIAEIQNLTVPSSPGHILLHIKLRIYMDGYGLLGLYNYNSQAYEIAGTLSPMNTSKEYYLDVYDESSSPIFLANATVLNMQVKNVSRYISNNSIRWYYRYAGEWALQAIYESEAKIEPKIKNPDSITLDIGNDGAIDKALAGELIGRKVHINQFNNSLRNDSFYILNSTSVTRYIKVPKAADIEKATLNVGDNAISGLALTLGREFEAEIASINPGNVDKNIMLGPLTANSRIITEGNVTNVLLEVLNNPTGTEVKIRDIFARGNNGRLLGSIAAYQKVKDKGDSLSLSFTLNNNSDSFDYLTFNYYYLENGKAVNREYNQFVGVGI